jgi:transposase, IS5 family
MARGDSFVVETKVHFPADTIQLFDAIRKVIELCARLSDQQGSSEWRQYAHTIRSIKRDHRIIQKLKHSTSKKPEKQAKTNQRIKEAHRQYLGSVDFQMIRATITIEEIGQRDPLLLSRIRNYMAHAEIQIDQIRRRIFNNEIIPHEEKVFSIFEPHTEWISKGKSGVPFELGLKVCIIEDQYGFILHHQVMEQLNDSDIAVSIVKETKSRFPNLKSISYDKGFHSPENQKDLKKLLEKVVMPKKGKLSQIDKENESDPEFKRLRKQHSAVESAINALEVHGLDRCPDHGIHGFKKYVALAVLGRNIHRFGALLMRRDARRRCRSCNRAA